MGKQVSLTIIEDEIRAKSSLKETGVNCQAV